MCMVVLLSSCLLLRYLAIYKMVLVYYLLLAWWVYLLYVFWSRCWVLVPWVLFAPNIFVGFVCYCVTCVHNLLNMFLKLFCGIFIRMYYFIYWYKGINLLFQCDFGTECPTRYRIWQFFNNFTTNEDIATKFEVDLSHCVRNVMTS